jgi:hypothetical protein
MTGTTYESLLFSFLSSCYFIFGWFPVPPSTVCFTFLSSAHTDKVVESIPEVGPQTGQILLSPPLG